MVSDLLKLVKRSRFSCPCCKGNLKEQLPSRYPRKWYTVVSRNTFLCPYCRAEIVNRFENFDIGLAMFATSNMFISFLVVLKIVWIVVLGLLVGRFVIGLVMPKYVLVGN